MFCQTGEWIRHKDAGGRVSGGPAKSCIVSPKRLERLLEVASFGFMHCFTRILRRRDSWARGQEPKAKGQGGSRRSLPKAQGLEVANEDGFGTHQRNLIPKPRSRSGPRPATRAEHASLGARSNGCLSRACGPSMLRGAEDRHRGI
ncbi:uncharacterized protein VDAG_00193 [Verticillium dahliae VdLs.17]|uniref:Uncharacterized protein n=1 Tax=Verticillium dahliae (strain VdLs.17 / ATCC MYA-4575 / FGSC 10137) TaxID=498257 RepID=G2WRL0_VERDV|nr:uncharacterized protein VDAG_00193 [Verticillium dahliae VdLs.17]EGY13511.1 hypothetical protein VDAG_00193 [Verticillium dahliae VdLs.17]